MRNNILIYSIIFVLAFLLGTQACDNSKVIEKKVPVTVEVPVPSVEHKFDTVFIDKIIRTNKQVIDSVYYNLYTSLKDSIKKDSMYKDAITIREYNEQVKDTFITIDLYAKTRGDLLSYKLDYKTEPYSIKHDTVIKYKFKQNYKPRVGIGLELGVPTSKIQEVNENGTFTIDQNFMIKANVVLHTKNLQYNLGYSTSNYVWGGISYFPSL